MVSELQRIRDELQRIRERVSRLEARSVPTRVCTGPPAPRLASAA